MSIAAERRRKNHRVRIYEGKFSNFDQIKECAKPEFCWGCEYRHPFCTEQGAVLEKKS